MKLKRTEIILLPLLFIVMNFFGFNLISSFVTENIKNFQGFLILSDIISIVFFGFFIYYIANDKFDNKRSYITFYLLSIPFINIFFGLGIVISMFFIILFMMSDILTDIRC